MVFCQSITIGVFMKKTLKKLRSRSQRVIPAAFDRKWSKKKKPELVKLKPAMFRVYVGTRVTDDMSVFGGERGREKVVVATTADKAMRKVRISKKKGEYYAQVSHIARCN
jgi:hypothetical protein